MKSENKSRCLALLMLAGTLNFAFGNTSLANPLASGQASGSAGAWASRAAAAPRALPGDLSSTNASVAAGALSNFVPLILAVGNSTLHVSPSTLLTPAELLAAQQVLCGGQQTLTLAAQGNAIGGGVTIGPAHSFSNLIVPAGVVVQDRVSAGGQTLSVAGLLQNSGQLNVVSSLAGAVNAVIQAGTIQNLAGGVISAGNNLNLGLVATRGITNDGVISAVNNLNLTTPFLVNTGTIKSAAGNIGITVTAGALSITGAGTIQALQGNINLAALSSTVASGITLRNGNYLSEQLNINAGCGKLDGDVQNVSGLVNITAGSSVFGAATPRLDFGTLNVAGDPTYFNTQGSLVLASISGTSGSDLALLALRDVIVKGGTLDTTNAGSSGGNLLIVAGATINSNGNPSGNNDAGTTITFSGNPSPSGGAINLSGVTLINTSGISIAPATVNGGNVTMAAFSGAGGNSILTPGSINLGSANVNTCGNGQGKGGAVNIYAGAVVDPSGAHAISGTGTIETGGAGGSGSYTGGAVTIMTCTPSIIAGTQVRNGAVVAGGLTPPGAVQSGSISIGAIDTTPASTLNTYTNATTPLPSPRAGNITITAGTSISAGNLSAQGLNAPRNLGGPAGGGGSGGVVNVTAGANSTTAANNITIAQISTSGSNGGLGADNAVSDTGGAGGSGGVVALSTTSGNITINPAGSAINTAGGAGNIGSTGGSGGAGGAGGSVTLTATNGTITAGAIDASGGGGAGGAGGTVAGAGGPGGAGGNVSLTANSLALNGYISAAGGGGGGAGGKDANAGGGGGGGGSTFRAGNGGNATQSLAGGGGGGGAYAPGTGGMSGATTPLVGPDLTALVGGTGATTAGGGAGGSGGTFSNGGAGGSGGATGDGGGAGGQIGAAGASDANNLSWGGAAGNGGTVTLTANSTLSFGGTFLSRYYPLLNNPSLQQAPHFTDSILTAGPGGGINITNNGAGLTTLNCAEAINNSNISLMTNGSTYQTYGTSLITSGTIQYSGSGSVTSTTAAPVLSFNSTGNVTVTDTRAFCKLMSSTVSGDLSLTATNGLVVWSNQTITAGGNLTLSNTGAAGNISVGDGAILTAGSLTAAGQAKLNANPLSPLVSSDICQAGNILIQTSGAAGNGAIFLGGAVGNVCLTAVGGNITLSNTKNGASINSLDPLTLVALGGSIIVNNYTGSANLGITGGIKTTLTALTLNTYTGGAINIIAGGNTCIGTGAIVNALGSMSQTTFSGIVGLGSGSVTTGGSLTLTTYGNGGVTVGYKGAATLSVGTMLSVNAYGGTLNLGSAAGNENVTVGGFMLLNAYGGDVTIGAASGTAKVSVGSTTNIYASGGINFTSGTTFASGNAISAVACGAVPGIFLGANVSITSGVITGAQPYTSSSISSYGSLVMYSLGSHGISGDLATGNDQLNVEGGPMVLYAVGTNANIILGDGFALHADGGSITAYSTGTIRLGILGGTAANTGGITINPVNGSGGYATIIATNGLAIGDGTTNTINGGFLLYNYGAANLVGTSLYNSALTLGAYSTTNVTGIVNIAQLGSGYGLVLNESAAAGSKATLTSTGFSSIYAGGTSTYLAFSGQAISLGTSVTLSSTGSGMSITSTGAGSVVVLDGSTVSALSSMNIYTLGSLSLGTAGLSGVQLSASATTGQLSLITASLSANGAAASTISSGGGLLIETIGNNGGINLNAGSVASGGYMTLLSLGSAGVIDSGATITANGGMTLEAASSAAGAGINIAAGVNVTSGGYTTVINLGGAGLTVGGSVAVSNGGLTVNQLSTNPGSKLDFVDGSSIQVTKGSLTLYSLTAADFGSIGGNKVTLNTSGTNASISITGTNGVLIGDKSQAGITAGTGTLSIYNYGAAAGDLVFGSNVSLSAQGGVTILNANVNSDIVQQAPAGTPTALTIAAAGGGISLTAYGARGGVAVSLGTAASLTAAGLSGITLSSSSPGSSVTIGDGYSFNGSAGSIAVSSAGALAVGTQTSTVGAPALSAASAIGLSGAGTVFLGAGTAAAGTTFVASSSAGSTQISAAGISANKTVTVSGFTAVTIDTSAVLTGLTGVSVSTSTTSTTTPGTVTIGGASVGVQITAGAGNPSSGNIVLPTDISSAGALVINSGTVNIGNSEKLSSFGGDLKVTAASGNAAALSIGNGNVFQANGGNIQMLAKGTVVVGTDSFNAYAVGVKTSPFTSSGGGIEVGSGLTASNNLLAAFALKQNTNPPPAALGTNVLYTGNLNGLIQANSTGGGVLNLNSTNVAPAALSLNQGVQVFDAQGAGASVQVNGGNFNTAALKPMALVTVIAPGEEDLADDLSVSSVSSVSAGPADGDTRVTAGKRPVELHVFEGGHQSAFVVPVDGRESQSGKQLAQIYAEAGTSFTWSAAGATMHLARGEVFLNAATDLVVTTDVLEVRAAKGALASVLADADCTYVRACSCSVSVQLDGRIIELNSGEELAVTTQHDDSLIHPADGLGRRHTHVLAGGPHYAAVSDFSIISLLAGRDLLSALPDSACSADRHLLARLLKTAASIDVVLKYRGAYSAR